jgi:ATP-dependent RNA helicase RhlE
MSFLSLGLAPALVRAGVEAGLVEPTPIQAEVIPVVLRGADLLGLAQTGSGKTAAFVLPVLQRLLAQAPQPRRPVRALVLVPTRELAAQVGEVFRSLGRHAQGTLKVAVLSGGVSVNPQMMGLRGGADVVVATPGRLLDLMDRNALRLSQVQVLVLDEADRLLDLGFSDELSRVLAGLPAQRQNLFFSATFPAAVEALAGPLLRDPVRVEAGGSDEPLPSILQRAILVDPGRRTELLRHLAQDGAWKRALVFVATRYATEHVAWKLYKAGLFASPLHGEMSQGKRTEVLEQFKSGGFDIVVTTDLAARGIDIVGLERVVNYDLPRSAVQYVHRIGRTGRAGQHGEAISFVSAATQAHFQLIEKRQGLVLPREVVAGFEPQQIEDPAPTGASPGTGGIKGKRPSKKDKLRAAAARDTPPPEQPPVRQAASPSRPSR